MINICFKFKDKLNKVSVYKMSEILPHLLYNLPFKINSIESASSNLSCLTFDHYLMLFAVD